MPQPMPPVTNPVLVDAMATFKVDLRNRDHERAFLQAAVEANYLLPAKFEPTGEPAKEGDPPPGRIAFQVMTTPENKRFMPAFTDEIEMRKNRKPGETFQVAVLPFMELYRFIKANEGIDGVVINPFGSALCLIRQQIIAIGDNGGQIVMRPEPAPQAGQNLLDVPPPAPTNALGAAENTREQQQDLIRQAMANMDSAAAESEAPEEDPVTDDLLGALKGMLKKQKAVKKAYIKQDTENGEKYLLIAIEADEGADLDAVQAAVAKDCADYSDLPFDCVPVNSIRAKELVASEKPFYEKKRFGIF